MILLTEVSQRKTSIIRYCLYREFFLKKRNTNEFIYKTGIDSQTQKINLWLPKGKGGG